MRSGTTTQSTMLTTLVASTFLVGCASPTSQRLGREDYQTPTYRSEYAIPAFKEIMGPTVTQMDVTLEAAGDPRVVKVTGRLEWEMPQLDLSNATKDEKGVLHPEAKGPMRLKTWYPGARHTIKGKLEVCGYTFASDRANPLVFRVARNRGYVYESGQGTITTPAGEKTLLRSAKQIALSPEQAKSAESAIKDGSIATFREMLDKDARLASGRVWGGQTLLFSAASCGRADMVSLLIDHGADVNAVDHFGHTPLFHAANMKNGEAARALLERGANVNAIDDNGETALHRAAISSAEMVRLLLNFGARVDVKDNDGQTPADVAIAFENAQAITFMKVDLDGAVANFTKAIERKPDYFAYIHRGYAKQTKGDLDGAIVDYTKAIELEPDYPQAYNNRGVARQTKGDVDGAKADYRKVLEIRPGDGEAQKRLDGLNRR